MTIAVLHAHSLQEQQSDKEKMQFHGSQFTTQGELSRIRARLRLCRSGSTKRNNITEHNKVIYRKAELQGRVVQSLIKLFHNRREFGLSFLTLH